MRGTSHAANRMLKQVGMYEGLPRIINVDAGVDIVGYTEINTQATTAFSRTKTHKGWFAGDAIVANGDRIVDKIDENKYLIMSIKDEFAGGRVVFKDGTLFAVNEICSINRFSTTLDAFGRVSNPTLTVVAEDVWAMVNPLVVDVFEQEDRMLEKDKIKLAIQASVSVAVNDRVITSTGEQFKVVAYSRAEINGINIVHIEPDTR